MGDDDDYEDPPTEMFMSPVAGQHAGASEHGDVGAVPNSPPVPNFGAPLPVPSTGLGASAVAGAPSAPLAAAPAFGKQTLLGVAPPENIGALLAAAEQQPPQAVGPYCAQPDPAQQGAFVPAPLPEPPSFNEPLIPGVPPAQRAPMAQTSDASIPIPGMPGALASEPMSSSPSRISTGAGSRLSVAGSSPAASLASVDVDAAPGWLKALAFTTVASAVLVLAVLGWLVSQRL